MTDRVIPYYKPVNAPYAHTLWKLLYSGVGLQVSYGIYDGTQLCLMLYELLNCNLPPCAIISVEYEHTMR